MNENLNLVEILKDCPIGTKLYSSAHGEVELEEVHLSKPDYPIEIRLSNNSLDSFTTDGRLFEEYNGECMLFPSREQHDWSKFKPEQAKGTDKEYIINVWHDASVRPKDNSEILVQWNIKGNSGYESYYTCCIENWDRFIGGYGVSRWAYIDDLLSKQFGNSEQLKSNE